MHSLFSVPMPPGPINKSESNFAYNNLQLSWSAPVNTIITKYEVTLDELLYVASSNDFTQFKNFFVPGKYYIVSIVTVSGTTNEKKSTEHSEWIRITPTSKNKNMVGFFIPVAVSEYIFRIDLHTCNNNLLYSSNKEELIRISKNIYKVHKILILNCYRTKSTDQCFMSTKSSGYLSRNIMDSSY